MVNAYLEDAGDAEDGDVVKADLLLVVELLPELADTPLIGRLTEDPIRVGSVEE